MTGGVACEGTGAESEIVRVTHRGEQPQALDEEAVGSSRYDNEFECTDKKVPFSPPRLTPRPVVRGAQTATVVGPAGEEIHVYEHGVIAHGLASRANRAAISGTSRTLPLTTRLSG